jgi:hypothetical protein
MFMENHHSKISEKTYTKRGEIPSKDKERIGLGNRVIYPEMPVQHQQAGK